MLSPLQQVNTPPLDLRLHLPSTEISSQNPPTYLEPLISATLPTYEARFLEIRRHCQIKRREGSGYAKDGLIEGDIAGVSTLH